MMPLSRATTGTEKEFGYEWEAYSEILPEHRDQFWTWVQPLQPDDFKGKSFLDAGCGMGRNSFWALRAGATAGVAFDFDQRTVAAAKRNLQAFPTCTVDYASIYEFHRPNEFDIVFCIGVLHHLADPQRAVAHLASAVKPGGLLAVWVYGKEGNRLYLSLLHPLRVLTKRLPLRATRWLAKGLAALLRGGLAVAPATSYRNVLRRLTFRHLERLCSINFSRA